jgi:hypothetical protein
MENGKSRKASAAVDRTYRARMSLLAPGELVLVSGVGGRGNTNVRRRGDHRPKGLPAPRP